MSPSVQMNFSVTYPNDIISLLLYHLGLFITPLWLRISRTD